MVPPEGRPDERQRSLIEAVSIDGVLKASQLWAQADDRYTASVKAIDSEVGGLRVRLKNIGGAGPETPGRPLESPAAAVAAMEAAAGAIVRAIQDRNDSGLALVEARKAAEATLQRVGDVKVARWAIGTIVVILLALLLTVQFYG
ncbi:MAG: hypothetical protein ABI624_05945 [Casimicrobiaceae bacterium]